MTIDRRIVIDTQSQCLTLYQGNVLLRQFAISTAKNGTGQLEGTGCTPLGEHVIGQKIGDGLPANAVFVARQFTGELYDAKLGQNFPNRDWILGRILWLEGQINGYNHGVDKTGALVDTKSRYIYIHGTPDTEPMGRPMSHGCIRMRIDEIVWLFDKVEVSDLVLIQ